MTRTRLVSPTPYIQPRSVPGYVGFAIGDIDRDVQIEKTSRAIEELSSRMMRKAHENDEMEQNRKQANEPSNQAAELPNGLERDNGFHRNGEQPTQREDGQVLMRGTFQQVEISLILTVAFQRSKIYL